MSAKKPNELIDRYEEMLRGTVSCYFDTDEIDEISDYYESKGQLSKALHAIEFGLNLHPDNVDLKLKEARYMLYLDRADEAKRIMSELADYSLDATLIRAELLFIDGYMKDGHALLLAMLDNDDIREDFCFDAVDIYTDYDCFDELVEFVEKAGKVLPDSRELFREMAAICEERSEYERSVIIYNKLIDKDPYSLQDWFSLAKVEALLKHYDKAVEACDFALAVKENEESIISFTAYVFMMIEAMADAAVADGMPRPQAYKFAAQAVMGSAKMVLETGKHPGELKDMVCSPAGTTIEAVQVLEERGFRSAIIEAMRVCAEKSRNM